LELGIGAQSQKNYDDGSTGPRKKFDEIFSRLERIHERDGQTDVQRDRRTDRQTPGDSKERAYA